MGRTGLEPNDVTNCSGNRLRELPKAGGAISGAVGNHLPQEEKGLSQLLDAWPRLSEKAKVAILAMIDAVTRT